jgi:histidinol-phosphate aminotransferase
MDIENLARPEIVAMRAYESARGSAADDGILLNANEAPQTLADDPNFERLALNRYPSPQPAALRTRLAGLYGVPESRLLVTRGSDEGIDLRGRVFCRPRQAAILESTPCFGMYRIAAAIQGARVINVPRRREDGLKVDAGALESAIGADDGIRLVFLTSPNNPTGDRITRAQLERVLRACEGRALVVLDEAYIEFCAAESACALIERWPQLVVLRTLSKAWAAAAVRCGAVIADPVVIGLLRRVIAPYPLPTTAVDAALQATGEEARQRQRSFVMQTGQARQALRAFLDKCPWVLDAWDSEANFQLIRVADANALVAWCARRGIRIRNFDSQPGLKGCVRITIGSEGEMETLKAALQAYGESL